MVYYTACTTTLTGCASSSNWVTTTINSAAGISGVAVANEQLLNTSLTFSANGTPYVTYMSGSGATSQTLGVADSSSGSFATTILGTSPLAAIAGAATPNAAMIGLSESSTRTPQGVFFSSYVGANNWLYATTCGD
jgi:hypothetical protein